MDIKSQERILQVYGILRMILGTAQLVGLSAGYLLTEWIIKYPKAVQMIIVDKEIIAITYFAVLLRGLFHVASGIGIARVKDWGRMWIFWGWPIIGIMTFGLVYATYFNWYNEGYVSSLLQIISLTKILLFLCLILFDYFFVGKAIGLVLEATQANGPINGMAPRKIGATFFITVLFFCLLLFLARPIKQGFHKGFYKASGKKSEVIDRNINLGKKSRPRKDSTNNLGDKNQDVSEDESFYAQIKKESIAKSGTLGQKGEVQKITKDKSDFTIEKGIPYRNLIGFVARFCLVIGLVTQIMEIQQSQSSRDVSYLCYVLFGIGFALLVFYGLSFQLYAIIIPCLFAFILSVFIIIMKSKYDNY